MYELSAIDWLICSAAAVMIGLTKTAIPGLGVLIVPVLILVVPPRESTGLMLPMLIMADVFAVAYYRRHVVWRHLIRLFPWAVAGILIGYSILARVNSEQLKPIIGGIILTLLVADFWRKRIEAGRETVPEKWWFAAVMGTLAGIATALANVAGPIMIVYLVAMGLQKKAFIGTGAWYYMLLNWFKLPFSASLGLVTWQSLGVNLMMFPVIAASAISGVFLLKRIPQRAFIILVQVLALAAAIRLLASAGFSGVLWLGKQLPWF